MTAPRTRVQRRPVHGVLLLDKPLGLSSNQALQKVKWLLRAEKAGHTGTLDPLATGVLPLCFGAATKFSQLHLDADKTYQATLQLGVKTTTGDAEGEVMLVRPVAYSSSELQAVVERFTGPIRQVPPMHSALKKDGKALYEYARAGIVVEREAREVVIHALHIEPGDTPDRLHLTVTCSKGTYIRTLGEDIGEALGCGAHLLALRRTATGPFSVAECVSLQTLVDATQQEQQRHLQSVDCLLQGHTRVTLDVENAGRFLSGMRRRGHWPDSERVAVFGSPGATLLGSGHVVAGELIPSRLLSPVEVQQILESSPDVALAA